MTDLEKKIREQIEKIVSDCYGEFDSGGGDIQKASGRLLTLISKTQEEERERLRGIVEGMKDKKEYFASDGMDDTQYGWNAALEAILKELKD